MQELFNKIDAAIVVHEEVMARREGSKNLISNVRKRAGNEAANLLAFLHSRAGKGISIRLLTEAGAVRVEPDGWVTIGMPSDSKWQAAEEFAPEREYLQAKELLLTILKAASSLSSQDVEVIVS